MRQPLSHANPFGHDRYGYLWEVLQRASIDGSHLDVGSYDGSVPAQLLESQVVSSAVAADVVDAETNYRSSYGAIPPGLDFHRLDGGVLPFPDGAFSSASLLDVLEHVANQGSLLGEVHRVLEPEGILVVTVPAKHLFSLLDTGNWKFVFPRLHRWYYARQHSQGEYEQRYVDPVDGLVGDIEIDKSWHEHFTPAYLAELLRGHGFVPYDLDGAGLLARPLGLVQYAVPQLNGALGHLAKWDARMFESTHLFSASRK